MLHTEFRENLPAGSGEEDVLKGFYHTVSHFSCTPLFQGPYFIKKC